MTQTSKEIFEKYQVRKTGKQKSLFRDYALLTARGMGYSARVEQGSFGAKNIVIGNPDRARVIYTAHYDTAPRLPMPNFITPKCLPLYILYQIVLTAVLVFVPMLIMGVVAAVPLGILSVELNLPDTVVEAIIDVVVFGTLFASMLLILIGPANKHTANDNTSGVTLIFNIMEAVPEQLRESVAFVLFDLEEVGLFGSSGFAAKHKDIRARGLLINFDCVSDGDDILFVLNKGAHRYAQLFLDAYPSFEGFRTEVLTKGAFYPSDQASFKCGVGVCALKRFRNTKLLYMNRIHTSRDTVYKEENIEQLTVGSVELVRRLSDSEKEQNLE